MLFIQNAFCTHLDDYSWYAIAFTDFVVQSILITWTLYYMLYVNRSKTTPLGEFDVPAWGYSILYHPEQEPKNT